MIRAGDDRCAAVKFFIRHQAETDNRNIGNARATKHRRTQLHRGGQRQGLACAAKGLPVVVARLFNPIGVGSAPTTALGSFVNQIAAMSAEPDAKSA